MVKNLYFNTDPDFRINKRRTHKIVSNLKKHLSFSINFLSVNFVDQSTIVGINKKYLQHNYTTDIITFNYSEEKFKLDGEIYISFKDAWSNAKKYGVSIDQEILRLIIHGILHLLGYDDILPADKKIMKNLENKLVKSYTLLSKDIIII